MLYIKLLKKEIKHRLGLLVVAAVAFAILFYVNGYTVGRMEYVYMLFALAACAVILSEDELDFLVMGHIQLPRVFALRFVASIFAVGFVPSVLIVLFTEERRPMKAVFSFLVTVLLIAAVGAFFRVLLKSTLASMIFSLIVFIILMSASELGGFSPFGAMTIANIKEFYWNRLIWVGIAAALIAAAMLVLKGRDHDVKSHYKKI